MPFFTPFFGLQKDGILRLSPFLKNRTSECNSPSAAAAIRLALREGEYEKRLPAIAEARRRVLEVHNFPALISRKLSSLSQTELPLAHNPIYRRRALWRKSPLGRMRYLADKARARARLLISLPAGKG